jgi:hypothetical protein
VHAALLIRIEVALQNIREKEDPQDQKHNEKFHQDNPPEPAAPGHPPESLNIEAEYFPDHGSLKFVFQN